ncbi:MAG: hypothetical protein ACK5ZV_09545 [bacterium]
MSPAGLSFALSPRVLPTNQEFRPMNSPRPSKPLACLALLGGMLLVATPLVAQTIARRPATDRTASKVAPQTNSLQTPVFTLHRPVGASVQSGDWTVTAVLSQGPSASAVNNLIATAAPESLIGDSLSAVWYSRSSQPDAPWQARVFPGQSAAAVMAIVKSSLSVSDIHDSVWPVPAAATLPVPVPAGVAFDGGLAASDPYAPVIAGHPNRSAVLGVLKDAGWAVAVLPWETLDTIDRCQRDGVLDGFAAALSMLSTVTSMNVTSMDTRPLLNTAADAMKAAFPKRCIRTIPLPFPIDDIDPILVLPPTQWLPLNQHGPWECFNGRTPGLENCRLCYREEQGRFCRTVARVLENRLEIATCCIACPRFVELVCCNVGPDFTGECQNPQERNYYNNCSLSDEYDSPPCPYWRR